MLVMSDLNIETRPCSDGPIVAAKGGPIFLSRKKGLMVARSRSMGLSGKV